MTVNTSPPDAATFTFLAGGGEMGALIRSYDWSTSPLGAPDQWPHSLRTALRIMLSSRQPIWIGWGEHLIYFYNDAYKSIIGGRHPWALGKPVREIWAEIWGEIGPMLATAMGGVEGIYVEEQLLIMERNGYPEETYYTFSYSPIPDDEGRPGGIICANTDDTDRVVGERQLSLLRDLGQQTAEARTLTDAYERSVAALGADAQDLTFALIYAVESGAPVARLIAQTGIGDARAAPLEHPLQSGGPWPLAAALSSQDTALTQDLSGVFATAPKGPWDRPTTMAAVLPIPPARDGGRSAVLVVGLNPYRLYDDAYRGFLSLVIRQIASAAAKADAFEEERRRVEALAELDRAKTLFFSNVSHEFRTPLTLMLGPLEDALSQDEASDAVRSQIALAHRNGARLLRLVNSLLDFSRIEAGRVRARFEATDLAEFSAEVASSFSSAFERAGVDFVIDVQPMSQPVFVDREMWEKVLLNLISNAFKFTLAGKVTVSVAEEPGAAVVRVADTGIGVAQAELPHLFERFHRVEGAQGRSFEGSGIGLALVAELVRLHGGSIVADSREGKGTHFTLRLPFGVAHLPADQVSAAEVEPARAVKTQEFLDEALRWLPDAEADVATTPASAALGAASADASRPGAGKRVLLADDNADMRGYVSRLLQAQGYEVTAVADGEAAAAAALAQVPDLVLSDVMMPKLDGFGLLRALRGAGATQAVPVILLSARAGEEAKVEGLEAGADDYMVKPFAARELIARVNANIQMAEFRRSADRALWRSEQRYRLSEDRLSIALSTGEVGVYEWEIDSDSVAVLGPLAELYGVDPTTAATAGLPLEVFLNGIHADDRERAQAAIAKSAADQTPLDIEYRVMGLGAERVVQARGETRDTPEGARVLAGAIIDVTEDRAVRRVNTQLFQAAQDEIERRRRVEDELHTLNAELEERVAAEVRERTRTEEALRQAQKMEAVGQLTGGVAHDFNNLLTVIIGGLDTIRRSRPEDTARIQRATSMAIQGAERAAALTTRLLAFSRRQPLQPKALDLNLLVREMTDLLHRSLGEQIELEGVLAPRLWTVEVDPNQLQTAVLNLAVNARDAMSEGGKLTIETLNAALDESYAATDSEVIPGQYAVLSVSDTGEGMAAETLAKVFEPFFTTKEVGKGTGLGLSMVYGFVKQSGGHVTLYSEPGEGTTVRLYFPRSMAAGEVATEAEAAPMPVSSDGETILVVEDNEDVRAYSTMILGELGYRILEAADADAALVILASDQRIDLLFTDVVLPGKSGRVLADEAAKLRPALKVLYTTGYSRNAIVHHGRLDAGVQLVSKPFTFEQLANRVRDVLDQLP
jgi:signal transduction histidine kinase/PleD family two-component response regulator